MTKGGLRLIAGMMLTLVALATNAQPRSSAHLLLGSDFGDFCTMCEAFVACGDSLPAEISESPQLITEQNQATLYYFPTRTFWQQVMTIWTWFKSIFVDVNAQSRPLTVYQIDKSNWQAHDADTVFSVEPPQISVPGGMIERSEKLWIDDAGNTIGLCHRLPLWETLDIVEALTGVQP